jgi:diguanylate cyclase (GGDEF)-like protein
MRRIYLNINKYIFFLLVLLIAFAIYLQYMVKESTDKLKAEEIHKTEMYAKNITEWIVKKTGDDIEGILSSDKVLREQLNEILETFLIPKYQYIFLLNKDNKGYYRFLLDGSKKEKEEFKTIFFPQNKLFDEVYKSQKVQIIKQRDDVKGVWLSLLYPVVIEGKTKALLVLDLSKWYGEYIENFNSPLSYLIRIMQVFLLLSFLFLIFLTYRYYHFRKTVLNDTLTTAHTKLYMEEFFNRNRVDLYNAILIDIDEFKEINRVYGYEKGDIVLKEFVLTLQSLLPKDASIIRIGGAEFFIFFHKKNHVESVSKTIFEEIKEKRYLLNNDIIKIRVSMSALEIPDDTLDIQYVLRMLDEELLKVKSHGKNRLSILNIQTFNDIRHRNIDYIKKALEDERLICHYQPIYDTEKRTIVKYEALARLIDENDPETLIMPSAFIDLIKGTSQYIKMSKLVLKEVFLMLERYKKSEFSVNLDLDDLFNYDMMQMIMNYLYTHKEVASRLTFEIVERNEIRDYAKVNFIFNQLREYGSKIAIDDFGSGYSNYSYLIRLNIDILKIDGSLTRELVTNKERAREVLSSIKSLADTFGYELVAEYVSNEEIYNEIRALGIEFVQGYYLGEPRSIDAYID